MIDTIATTLEAHAVKTPSRLAYWDEYHQVGRTYQQLDERANRLANALLAAGIAPGDRIAVWMKSSIATVEVYFAAAKAGFVVTPVNERFKVTEANFQLRSSGARALLFGSALKDYALELASQNELALVVSDLDLGAPGVSHLEQLMADASPAAPAGPGPDDLFLLGYTSGTTGHPKGAMLTHQSMRAAGRLNALSYRLPIGSIGLYRGSMSFVATIGSFLMSHLHVGGTVIIHNTGNSDELVDAIIRHGANYTSIATPLLDGFRDAVVRRPDALDLLTSVLHGASAAPAAQLRSFVEVFGGRFLEGWGMTEHSGALVTATTRLDVTGHAETSKDVFASVGRAVPDTVVRLVDSDRNPAPHDGVTIGELVISSPALAIGYWGNEAATAESFVDGWYYTGDLATIDEAGYVHMSDRRSDLIVSGGMNIYPSEVELVIGGIDGVSEVAVVGAAHEVWGQTVIAVIVTKPGSDLTEEAVIEQCRTEMAGFKKPTKVLFMDELPKTASEKIKRQDVRDTVELMLASGASA